MISHRELGASVKLLNWSALNSHHPVCDKQQVSHDHVDARYVGPAEGCWRLFGSPLHVKSHHVERLAVHLPDHKTVDFAEGDEREALSKASTKLTTLEAWFAFNLKHSDLRHVLYIDMPLHCVWNKQQTAWT